MSVKQQYIRGNMTKKALKIGKHKKIKNRFAKTVNNAKHR